MRRSAPGSVVFYLLLVLSSCTFVDATSKDGGEMPDPGDPDAGGPVTGGVTVQPSAQSQVVTLGGVSVTIPGGSLPSEATLTVAPSTTATQLAKPAPDTKILGAYDITLGSYTDFDQALTLEFHYDPATLDAKVPEGKNLWVSAWDPATSLWSLEPTSVDTARHVIAVRTKHLSTWIFWTLSGYDYVPSSDGPFEVYYHPNHQQPRDDVAPTYTMRDLADDVDLALSSALEAYTEEHFIVPTYQVKVIITDAGSSNMSPYTGNIFLDRKELHSLALVRHDSGHELFHVVQNQYSNVYSMGRRTWWTEGSPDYASSMVAWNDPTTLPPLISTYFDETFVSPDLSHSYQNSQFIQYLVSHRGLNFKAMWDAVATESHLGDNGLAAFQKHVSTGTGSTFDQVWVDFVDYACFGPGHPMAQVGLTSFKLKESINHGTRTAQVPSYAATIVMVEAEPSAGKQTRSVNLSVAGLTSGTLVEIWQGLNRDPATAALKTVLVDDGSWSVVMGPTDSIFAAIHNTGGVTRSVTVTATTAEEADAGVDADATTVDDGSAPVNASCSEDLSGNTSSSTQKIELGKSSGTLMFMWDDGGVYGCNSVPSYNYALSYEGTLLFTTACACGSTANLPYSGTATFATLTVSSCPGGTGGWWKAYVGCP